MGVIDDWTRYINRQIVTSQYRSDCIMNFDETNVDFDPSPRSTLCKVGEKTVSLRISGHSGRATVMLGCTASGHKFPAYIIWKGVRNGRIDRECRANMYPPENQVYTVQPKGWMDGVAYKDWVQDVVAPYAEQQNNRIYLLQDQFSIHTNADNITALQTIGVEVDFIPADYTPVLQVMDKGMHKPFKQYLRELSVAWMVAHGEARVKSQLVSTSPTGYKSHGIKCQYPPFSILGLPLVFVHIINNNSNW
jgi:hypothetical protein